MLTLYQVLQYVIDLSHTLINICDNTSSVYYNDSNKGTPYTKYCLDSSFFAQSITYKYNYLHTHRMENSHHTRAIAHTYCTMIHPNTYTQDGENSHFAQSISYKIQLLAYT